MEPEEIDDFHLVHAADAAMQSDWLRRVERGAPAAAPTAARLLALLRAGGGSSFFLTQAAKDRLGADPVAVEFDIERLMTARLLAVNVRHVLPSEFVLVCIGDTVAPDLTAWFPARRARAADRPAVTASPDASISSL